MLSYQTDKAVIIDNFDTISQLAFESTGLEVRTKNREVYSAGIFDFVRSAVASRCSIDTILDQQYGRSFLGIAQAGVEGIGLEWRFVYCM